MAAMSATTVTSAPDTVAYARGLAQRFAADVRDHFGSRVRAVRLYGSAARGDWTPESDIDILVLFDRVSGDDSEWLVNRAVKMGLLDSGLLLQPLFMAEADYIHLRDRERRFAIEVDREGKDL
jgi:predicted nucleotidyltransferase